MDKYDVIVIGAGPAGYVCAIKCAQLGFRTLCVEKWQDANKKQLLGGTCLNVGCIPSKALLETSHKYFMAQEEFSAEGIKINQLSMDLAAMQARKNAIINKLCSGVASLFKANGVESAFGSGRLLKSRQVEVTDNKGKNTLYQADNVVLASGSVPIELPFAPFDGKNIVDSTGALAFTEVPKRLGVIGAGIIGLELGSVWRRLGAEVVVLEALEDLLPMVDSQISKDAARHFKKQGLDIRLGAVVAKAKKGKDLSIGYKDSGGEQQLRVDKLVVAVGRKPFSEGLLGDDCGVKQDEKGFVIVDDQCRTDAENVYAIGDLVRGPMLAHKGSEEGVMVAELISNKKAEMNYGAIPSVIYTAPEIAWVGINEEEARQQGIDYKSGTFPFAASGRAMANNDVRGLVKIIADKKTDAVLGVHIIGPQAGELIAQAVLAMEFMASSEDIQLSIFAHPTLGEAIHEAALAVDGRAIHAIAPRR